MFNKERLISVGVLSAALVVSGILVASAQTTSTAPVANPFAAITYPIPELGNCADQGSCKTYCDAAANASACLNFAEAHNLMSRDQIEQARKMANIVAAGNAPGGCTSKDSCENYCENSAHIDECIGFAEKNGLLKGKDLDEAKKVLPFIKSGETPGGCTSKDSCQAYCADSSHVTECVAFAQKAGLLSKEEADMVAKTGGKGPGGCTSKDSCEAFCNQKENQQTCFDFAKEHDLIPADQLKQIEEGTAKLRMGLAQFPGEVVQCLKDKIGSDAVGQIESGKLVPNKDIGDTIQGCFDEFKPKMRAKLQEGLKNAPPEVTSCLQNALGTDGFQKMRQGDVSSPEDGDKIKDCFEQMKKQGERQMLERFQQMDQLPGEVKDCIKQKLGNDIFDKLQSGDTESIKSTDAQTIQSTVMSCANQFKPQTPSSAGENEMGITNEQTNEMTKSGAAPSQEQIQKMIEKGVPSNIPGGPTPEQLKNLIRQGQPGGQIPGGIQQMNPQSPLQNSVPPAEPQGN